MRADPTILRARFSQRGQATVEMIACLPALLLAGLVALQLAVAGYTLTLADGAAEAAALAIAADRSPQEAAQAALPGWAKDRVRVSVDGGKVEVSVRPPSPLTVVSDRLEVSSTAIARAAR